MPKSRTSEQKEAFLEEFVTHVNSDIYAITDRFVELAKGGNRKNKVEQIEKEIHLELLRIRAKILQAFLADFRLDYRGNLIPCSCGNTIERISIQSEKEVDYLLDRLKEDKIGEVNSTNCFGV